MALPPSTRSLSKTLAAELAEFPQLSWKLQGLKGGASAYVLSSLLAELERPALVITPNDREAEAFATELRTFLDEAVDEEFLARRVHLFPGREAPPLEMISPAADVEAARTAALYQLRQMKAPLVVTSPEALAVRTQPVAELLSATIYLVVGDDLYLEDFGARLEGLGYRRVGTVEEPGEVAVRGGIIDLWPPGAEYPCRCELLGDSIESIRLFDPDDQRSFETGEELVVLPALPFALERLAGPEVRRAVAARCEDLLLPTSERRNLDGSLGAGIRFPGVELLAPYVNTERAWLADYLTDSTVLILMDPPAAETALDDLERRLGEAAEAADAAGTFYPEPADLYVDSASLSGLLGRRPVIELDYAEAHESGGKAGHRVWRIDAHSNTAVTTARVRVKARRGQSGFRPVVDALEEARAKGSRLIVTASDQAQLSRLQHLLAGGGCGEVNRAESFADARAGSPEVVRLIQGNVRAGFALAADGLTVVTDEEIFGERRGGRRRRRASRAQTLNALRHLEAGDHVVHVDHGIGLYHGLKHMLAAGTEGDFLHVEYAGGDRYYLPVDRINLLEKYTGSGAAAPALDRLGGSSWARTKQRARDSILEMARELLDLEAFRAVRQRDAWVATDADFEEFEARFAFEETEGQLGAIRDIVADLGGEKPMDRVVCGDVGYGKTEVAVRAAYLCAMGGRQAALLVPTTVLARQHYDTLLERFDGYPVDIRMLSRFNSRAENAEIARELTAGSVDIVVGTHRLLQKDVEFASLGLLVIDEEHRFGVKAKEHIKQMRRQVDVLTMTATPIPRTLQLAMSGVRDLSLIETPPVDRLAIRTYVARYDEGLIRQAIRRELGRGGQVFFVHNRVSSIEIVARRMRELLPGARVAVAHGQMKELELEHVMVDFLDRETDVLVCTSIIESGLDISNANTILVNRADTFGLAQLYQIRGRVGRSHRRAYAYLLVPGEGLISEEARKRLAVLQELDDLGAGFRLAAHDMEIRGAGNLLGKQQSGHIAAVGFDLFMRMMEETTLELRGQPAAVEVEPEIELGAEAFIPAAYIEDVGERLLLYKRLANAATREQVEALAGELADRFGGLPRQAQDFVRIMAVRPALKWLAVESLKASDNVVALRLSEDSPVDREQLLRLVTSRPKKYRLRPEGSFTVQTGAASWNELVDEIEALLETLLAGIAEGGRHEGSSAKDDDVDEARRPAP